MTSLKGALVLSSIILCAIISNSPSLFGDFVFDDSEAIQGNEDVAGHTSIGEVFEHDFWGNNIRSKRSHKSYRPLTVLTFRLDAWLSGGLDPAVFHVHNILLYVMVALLYRHVVERLSGSKETADWSALLFAAHPIHTEVVSSVVGRAEMTSSLCYLVSILSWRNSLQGSVRGITWLLVAGGVAGIGMLCKEQSVTVLGVCALWELLLLFVGKKGWGVKWNLCRCVVYGGCVVSILWLRWIIMAGTTPTFQKGDNPGSFAADWLTRTMNYSYIWALNAYLLALPFWLCFDWSMGCLPILETVWDIRNAATAVLCLFLAALTWRCARDLRNARNVELTAGLVAALVPFFPASNILFRVGFVVAERILFLTSMGSCFLVAHSAPRVKWFRAGLVSLCVLFLVRSYRRSSDWVGEEALYKSGLNVCPSNAKVHYNVANVVSRSGQVAEAEERYREAVRLFPEYDQALNNLGNLLREKGEWQEAHQCLSAAVGVSPEFAAGWMNKGIVELNLKLYDQSEQSLLNAIRFRKKYPDAYYNLGNLYLETGDMQMAERAFRDTIRLKRRHKEAWVNLCLNLENSAQLQEAESAVDAAISVFPADSHFLYTRGNLLGRQRRFSEAERAYLGAIALDPLSHKHHGNLGVLYHLWGRLELAEESYKRTLELEPGDATTRKNYDKLANKRRSSSQ